MKVRLMTAAMVSAVVMTLGLVPIAPAPMRRALLEGRGKGHRFRRFAAHSNPSPRNRYLGPYSPDGLPFSMICLSDSTIRINTISLSRMWLTDLGAGHPRNCGQGPKRLH